MGQAKHGPDTSYEERAHRRVQVVYARKTQQRQVFMDDLKKYRKKKDKRLMTILVNAIGPTWYQALSVPQRKALDTLEFSLYQDMLQGRPARTRGIIKTLGIWPHPSTSDLMECIIYGRADPKEMLAQLFQKIYGHTIDGKRSSYDLNARLMLSSILYLGLENLIHLLRERFRPDTTDEKKKPKKTHEIQPPLESPYLQKMVAHLWDPPKCKPRLGPAPLPNLDDLNEPYEEEPPIPKSPPLPPPPPPPKKKVPRAYCDKLAGIMRIEPHSSAQAATIKPVTRTSRRKHLSKIKITFEKKVYGIGSTRQKRGSARRKRPPVPTTGMWNTQYMINGVTTVQGRTVYVLGNVSVLPASGDLIHGGHRLLNGQPVNIHCGYRGIPPPPKPDPCDCVKKWTDKVLNYVKITKCYCGHRYDYNNKGTFLAEELPYFEKPTRHTPCHFNYHTIYDLDPKRLHIDKEFKRVWERDSVLRIDDGTQDKKKSKKKKRSSSTCLGQNPAPEDYLKCALRLMRGINIAARLPDIHLVPELREWMRRRIYGPYSLSHKAQMITESNTYWQMFTRFAAHGIPHVPVPKIDNFKGQTNWFHKQDMNNEFRKFIMRYKIEMYRAHARFTNLMWPSMFQAQFPDKKFREIYFSYLFGTIQDLALINPYSLKEVAERNSRIRKKRYICKPTGFEPPT